MRDTQRQSKEHLKQELLALLQEQLTTARAAHAAAIEGAFHEEAKPENDKDTRGLEQSYLARGYAARVAELETAVAAVEALTTSKCAKVSMGALVTIDEDARERSVFVAPGGGGLTLAGGVTVVTPTSPMGKALLGKVEDDEAELVAGGAQRTLVITAIR